MSELLVVLDTNVLVAGLAYPRGIPARILTLWRNSAMGVATCSFILAEARRVLPKMNRVPLTASQQYVLLDDLEELAEKVDPGSFDDQRLRDPFDQQVLGTLVVSRADYLITGDKDLLALASSYPIVTPREFWSAHGEKLWSTEWDLNP